MTVRQSRLFDLIRNRWGMVALLLVAAIPTILYFRCRPDKFVGDEQAAFNDCLAPYLADSTLTLVQQFNSVTVYVLKQIQI